MAFVNPNDPNAPNAPANPLNQQAPISSGGAGVGGATKPQNTPGINVPAQPSAQLSAYLTANQPQAAAFGQNVAQDVAGQIGAAGASINPAVNTYTGNLYSVPTDATVNSAVAASPSALTPEQKATYQKELGAAGASPNAADTFETTQGYQDAASKIQRAVSQADLWNSGNSVPNLTAALAPYEGANATAGDRTLDSLLLSRTPEAYGAIQAAVAPAADFQNQLSAGTDSANAALRAAIVQNQATTDASQGAAQTYAQGLNRTLADYLANAQKSVIDYNGQINPLLQSVADVQPQISGLQDAIDAYNALLAGGPGKTGVPLDLPGVNFSPIKYGELGQAPSTIGMPDVAQLATSGQYSDIAALRELLGDSAFGSLNTSINPEQASLAGTWSPQNNATIPNLAMLVDPLTSQAIQTLMPNVTALQNFAPAVQASAPLGSDLRAIQEALAKLQAGVSGKPPAGTPTEPPPPPQNAVPPSNGQPGNEAWFNWFQKQNGGTDLGFPSAWTYQDYVNSVNSGSGGGLKPS